jgi:hypothetical protein
VGAVYAASLRDLADGHTVFRLAQDASQLRNSAASLHHALL